MISNDSICFYAVARAVITFIQNIFLFNIWFTFNSVSSWLKVLRNVLYLSAGRICPSSLPLLLGHHQENSEPHYSYDKHQGHHTTHDDCQVYVTGERFLHHKKCSLILFHGIPEKSNLIIWKSKCTNIITIRSSSHKTYSFHWGQQQCYLEWYDME